MPKEIVRYGYTNSKKRVVYRKLAMSKKAHLTMHMAAIGFCESLICLAIGNVRGSGDHLGASCGDLGAIMGPMGGI